MASGSVSPETIKLLKLYGDVDGHSSPDASPQRPNQAENIEEELVFGKDDDEDGDGEKKDEENNTQQPLGTVGDVHHQDNEEAPDSVPTVVAKSARVANQHQEPRQTRKRKRIMTRSYAQSQH